VAGAVEIPSERHRAPHVKPPLRGVGPTNPHFNTQGQPIVGRLFARGYLELHKKRPAKVGTGAPE
jgi:hypothetical protein